KEGASMFRSIVMMSVTVALAAVNANAGGDGHDAHAFYYASNAGNEMAIAPGACGCAQMWCQSAHPNGPSPENDVLVSCGFRTFDASGQADPAKFRLTKLWSGGSLGSCEVCGCNDDGTPVALTVQLTCSTRPSHPNPCAGLENDGCQTPRRD